METEDFNEIMKELDNDPLIPELHERWEYYKDKSMDEITNDFKHWYVEIAEKGRLVTAKKKALKIHVFFRDTNIKNLEEVNKEKRKAHKIQMKNMIHNGTRKQNYVATILTDLNVFFCQFLGREDLRVHTVRKEPSSPERLTREELDRMIVEVEKRDDISLAKRKLHKTLLKFFWNQMPRTSEGTKNLMLKDVHLDLRTIRLRSGKRDKLPKKFQNPYLTQESINALEEYLPYRDSEDKSSEAKLFIQPGTGGRPVSTKFMQNMVKEYAARAGIKKRVIPYLLRKSGGTELGMKNIGLAQLQLGHKNPKTTLENYFIPNNDDKRVIDTTMRSDSDLAPEIAFTEIIRSYINSNAIDDQEFLFALKAFKKQRDKIDTRGEYDVSIV